MEALTYRMEGDYLLPNLLPPEEPPVTLGKYALMRKKHLRENRRILFTNLLTTGTLNQHLTEIERAANERIEQITRQMARAEGVTEKLKTEDQITWVGLMNSIRQRAEEMILSDLIYA